MFRPPGGRPRASTRPSLTSDLGPAGPDLPVALGSDAPAALADDHAVDAGTTGEAVGRVDLHAGRLALVADALSEAVLVLDEHQRVVAVNPAATQLLGLTGAMALGRPIDDLATWWPLRDRGPFEVSKMRHHLHRGLPYRNDDAFVVVDHGIVPVSLVMDPIVTADGARCGTVIALRDVTALKRAEAQLGESEDRFRRIFRQAPIGMLRLDVRGVVAAANHAIHEVLVEGGRPLAGRTLDDLLAEPGTGSAADEVASLLAGERDSWTGELRLRRDQGDTVVVNASVARITPVTRGEPFAIMVCEDVTEQRRLEVELRHAQKLESIGRLAAGIAHEINTPLQFVGDNLRFVDQALGALRAPSDDRSLDPSERAFLVAEAPRALREALDGLERVGHIVDAMRRFGRAGDEAADWQDADAIVRTAVVVATNELRQVDEVEVRCGEVPAVWCSRSDLNQVVMNLLLNAVDAVADQLATRTGPASRRGQVTVTTRARDGGVEIAVADTGVGIPDHVRPHIFDPFFTTKEVGRGTGQGLALVQAVVDRYQGRVEVSSEVDVGSTFRVWLPCAPEPTG